jgi:hypothetical protein
MRRSAVITNEIELIRRYRETFPEDVDRMAWMLTLASSRGMTREFGCLLSDALDEDRRVDWGPLFGVLKMARIEGYGTSSGIQGGLPGPILQEELR